MENDKTRVVRGGSWFRLLVFARAVPRSYLHPNFRFDDLGFRVVCGHPILNSDLLIADLSDITRTISKRYR